MTNSTDEQIIELYLSTDIPVREIAARFGVARETVYYRLRTAGVAPNRNPAGHRLWSKEELLDHMRVVAAWTGRTPTDMDLRIYGPPTEKPYYRAWGSLREAQRAAGLRPNCRGRSHPVPEGFTP